MRVEQDESRASSLLAVAETYLKTGMKKAAIPRFKEVVEKFPATKAASAAKERLKTLEE